MTPSISKLFRSYTKKVHSVHSPNMAQQSILYICLTVQLSFENMLILQNFIFSPLFSSQYWTWIFHFFKQQMLSHCWVCFMRHFWNICRKELLNMPSIWHFLEYISYSQANLSYTQHPVYILYMDIKGLFWQPWSLEDLSLSVGNKNSTQKWMKRRRIWVPVGA